MKRFILFVLIMPLLAFGCTIASTPTQAPPPTLPPVTVPDVTLTPTEATTELPTLPPVPTQPPVATNTTCNELKLFLDPALASGYDCKTVPEENSGGPAVNPAYTELTLQGYPLSGRFFEPHIDVFSVQSYVALAPDFTNGNVSQLMALISGGPVDKTLPFMPNFNAAQEFHAQYNVLPFGSGSGIRYLTQYAQFYDPINNHEIFYTYQGLTADGKYWVSAVLPISNAILPADGNTPPGGLTQEQFANQFDTYIADITTQLNGQTAASFTPTLVALDALVSSIQVQP